jgi:hypothetical protein
VVKLALDRHPKVEDLKRGVYLEGFAPGDGVRRTLWTFDYKVKGRDGASTFFFVDAGLDFSFEDAPLPVPFSWSEVQTRLLLVPR